MENRKIILFKRSKSEDLKLGVEYILCTNEKPTLMASNLEIMSNYINTLSKIKGKRVGIEYSVPNGMNSGYFYDNLTSREKNKLKMYSAKKIF